MNIVANEVEVFVWDALYSQSSTAKAKNLAENFSAFGESDDSLKHLVVNRIMKENSIPDSEGVRLFRDAIIVCAIREVYFHALHLGLIIPGLWTQSLNWGAADGAYQFTDRGIQFFGNGEISISIPGVLVNRVDEVIAKNNLGTGLSPLVAEAQKCWHLKCLRASMVLIGLASEEACTTLLDELCKYQNPPVKGHPLRQEWDKLQNQACTFYPRWQSGLELIVFIKRELKKTYGSAKPEWWRIWEPFPGAVQPYAEAVRIGRNTAAHSVDDIFTSSQIGLLLASLPSMLEVVGELTGFLQSPPSGVVMPKF